MIAKGEAGRPVIAVHPPGGLVQTRCLCRRLRRRFKDLSIVVGYWGRVKNFDRLLVRLRKAGASYVVTSVQQARTHLAAKPLGVRRSAPSDPTLAHPLIQPS